MTQLHSENKTVQHVGSLNGLIEALLFASDKPLSIDKIAMLLVDEGDQVDTELKSIVRKALQTLKEKYATGGIELVEVASGFRFQVHMRYADAVSRLWDERPQKYSRALLETLALIAYRQPITRGDIEEIRGVSVSSNIIKTLMEREWVRIVGHREVPGRPAIFATTRHFLDHFNLQSLDQLPTLAQMREMDDIARDVDAEFQFGSGADSDAADKSGQNQVDQSSDSLDLQSDDKQMITVGQD